MSALIHALFDRPDIAAKAKADLEGAGIGRNDITIVEAGAGAAQEASQLLDQHGISSETASTYIAALGRGGAFLWLQLGSGVSNEAEVTDLLERNGAILIDRALINDDADELSEADGWNDFTDRGNEHSPDSDAESMWVDRNGNPR